MTFYVALGTNYNCLTVSAAPIFDGGVMMDMRLIWWRRNTFLACHAPYFFAAVGVCHLATIFRSVFCLCCILL